MNTPKIILSHTNRKLIENVYLLQSTDRSDYTLGFSSPLKRPFDKGAGWGSGDSNISLIITDGDSSSRLELTLPGKNYGWVQLIVWERYGAEVLIYPSIRLDPAGREQLDFELIEDQS